MHAIPLPILITFIVSFAAAGSRIFNATKPFWGLFPGWLQVLFPTLPPFLAALQAGASGSTSWTDLVVVFIGAAALLLPGLPSHRSSAPLPNNSAKPPGMPPLSAVGMLMLAFLFGLVATLTGCAFFESKLPDAEKCLPTPASLAAQVAAILAAGGDTTAALEQLAVTQTEHAVVCAVEAFLGKPGAGPNESPARARAQAYLATKGAR